MEAIVGAEARREDRQSAAAIFLSFLRILDIESRKPQPHVQPYPNEGFSIAAICLPTSLSHVRDFWPHRLVQQLDLYFRHVEFESFSFRLLYIASPHTASEGQVRAGRAPLTCRKSTTAEQLRFQRLGSTLQEGLPDSGDHFLTSPFLSRLARDRLPHGLDLLEDLSHLLTRFR